jgi:hypothetical protein
VLKTGRDRTANRRKVFYPIFYYIFKRIINAKQKTIINDFGAGYSKVQ